MRTYSADVYRDDVVHQEAAYWSFTIGESFSTPEEARDAIRRAIATDGWDYGSIHEGDFTPAIFGVAPARFESDENVAPWQVGPDWYDRG